MCPPRSGFYVCLRDPFLPRPTVVSCFASWEQKGLGVEDFGTLRASLEREARRHPARLVHGFEKEQAAAALSSTSTRGCSAGAAAEYERF